MWIGRRGLRVVSGCLRVFVSVNGPIGSQSQFQSLVMIPEASLSAGKRYSLGVHLTHADHYSQYPLTILTRSTTGTSDAHFLRRVLTRRQLSSVTDPTIVLSSTDVGRPFSYLIPDDWVSCNTGWGRVRRGGVRYDGVRWG